MNEGAITRARLAAEVARAAGITRAEANLVVEAVFDAIADALRAGDEVEIRGFGSFRLRSRKERLTRNPRTGERIVVPPKRVPFFRAGKALRARLNRDPADARAADAPPAEEAFEEAAPPEEESAEALAAAEGSEEASSPPAEESPAVAPPG